MTAEVAILNRHAVVMAADSAVTVKGRTTKVHNTVNKLFMLSKHQPVGIMVYSSADLVGIPVETVIKYYRSQELNYASFDNLSQYAGHFFEFLSTDTELLGEQHRVADFRFVARRLLAAIASKLEGMSIRSRTREMSSMLKLDIALAQASDRLPRKKADYQSLTRELNEIIDNWVRLHVQHFTVSAPLLRLIRAYLREAFSRSGEIHLGGKRVSGVETGIVIAGFGNSDAFPRLIAFEFVFSAFGFTKFYPPKVSEINDLKRSEIIGFAQTDQIEAFIYDRTLQSDEIVGYILQRAFDSQIGSWARQSHSTNRAGVIAALNAVRDDVKEEFTKLLARWSANQHRDLEFALESLPKEELAMIAEALINLTIAKRRASEETDSVGPPVDVAVISKGDGFIWMKRKHYFDIDLNMDFQKRG